MPKKNSYNYKLQEGFTTVELLVSIAILAILVSVFGSIFMTSLNSANVQEGQSLLKSKSQIIIARLGKELRGAVELDTSTSWPANELPYKLDITGDGSINQVGRWNFDTTTNSLKFYKREDATYPTDWSSYLHIQFIGGEEIKLVKQTDNSGNEVEVFNYNPKFQILELKFRLVYHYKDIEIDYPVNHSINLRNIGNFNW